MDDSFEKRKKSHFFLSLDSSSQSIRATGFDKIRLIHSALPDLDIEEVSIEQKWRGHVLKTPFFVSSMTGGWKDSKAFNLKLAKACAKHSWIMAVGSQRAQLEDPSKAEEWKQIRKAQPNLILLGNLGLSQLLKSSISDILRLVESLKAQGMIIHLNPLQEAIQKEGTAKFKGGLKAIEKLVKELALPVIVKETGCGMSKETLDQLTDIGLAVLDVSGLGGTHWGRIEGKRYDKNSAFFGIGESFSSWGIPTVESLIYSREKPRDYELWASGGLRTGLDSAKALAIGASFTGFGQIILKALHESEQALDQLMSRLEYELKISLFCTGSVNIKELQRTKKWEIIS
ncbi:MAG: type 2 isopentenyl-diphosphate Delta-isomerase [Bdellovibrionaceae bacterium]|nr:type 2 isopentenyl-diphosphate Delta-isomerase [Pseudobdellovibrionaceae bacterium]